MPSKRVPRKPAQPLRRVLPDIIPPLVRVADCWTNRSTGRYGYTPYSRKGLTSAIRLLGIEVRRLGPRTNCITRADVLRLCGEAD